MTGSEADCREGGVTEESHGQSIQPDQNARRILRAEVNWSLAGVQMDTES